MDIPAAETVRVIDSAAGCPSIPLVVDGGHAKVVIWPGNGARCRTFQILSLDPGAKTILLNHSSDAVYYVVSGSGCVAGANGEPPQALIEGSMVHIDAGDAYRFSADRGEAMEIIGGPCPADERLYSHLVTR